MLKKIPPFLINTAVVILFSAFGVALFEVALQLFVEEETLVGSAMNTYDIPVNVLVSPLSPQELEAFRWDGDGDKLLHTRSSNKRLVYEMRPNAHINDMLYTNADGFRDGPFSKDKADNVFRIVAVGDSITFGWYEWLEETYPKVLESMLNEYTEEYTVYEVYNMGVGGYNAEQEFELIRSRVIEYDPDLIILQYCVNDNLVGVDAGLYDHFTRGRLQTMNLLRRVWKLWTQYRPGEDLLERNYRRLATWQQNSGIPMLVVFFPEMDTPSVSGYERHFRFSQALGLNCLSLAESYWVFSKEQIFHDVFHPNALGHRIAAEEIFIHLVTDVAFSLVADASIDTTYFTVARDALLVGLDSLKNRDYEKMSEFYRQAVALIPAYARYTAYSCLNAARQLRLQEDNYTDALFLAQLAHTWRPEYPDALLEVARNIKHTAGLEQSVEAYERFIALKGYLPPPGKSEVELSDAWQEMGDLLLADAPEKALDAWRNAIRSAPWYTTAYEALEEYHLSRGEAEALVQEYLSLLEEYIVKEKFLVQALRKIEATEYTEALLSRALEAHPESYMLVKIRADRLAAAGDFAQAEVLYLTLIQKEPDRHEAFYSLFALYETRGNWAGIKNILENMLRRHPERYQAHNYLADVYQRIGEYEAEERVLRHLYELSPGDLGIKVRLAENHVQVNKIEQAKKVFSEILFTVPEFKACAERFMSLHHGREMPALSEFWSDLARAHPDAVVPRLYLGITLEHMENLTGARTAYEQALLLNSNCAETLLRLGMINMSSLNMDEGMEHLRKAAALAPEHRALIANALYNMAAGMTDEENYHDAERLYALAAEILPSDTRVHARLATLKETEGDSTTAIALYSKILSEEPERPDIAARMETLFQAADDEELACAFWSTLVENHPDARLPYLYLGAAHERMGAYDDARNIYISVSERHPNFAAALYRLGVLDVAVGNKEDGITRIRRAVALEPELSEAIVQRAAEEAARLADSGSLDAATILYRLVLEISPGNINAAICLADIHAEQGEADTAASFYMEALSINPNLADAAAKLDGLLMTDGDDEKADAFWRTLMTAAPNAAVPPLYLGITLKRRGILDEAHDTLAKALALDPENARIIYHLGEMKSLSGNLEEGMAWIRRAAEHDPDILPYIMHNVRSLIQHFISSGNSDAALRLCRMANEIRPEDLWAQNEIAQLFELAGDSAAAAAIYGDILMSNPDFPLTTDQINVFFHETGTWEYMQKLVEVHPHAAAAYYYLGMAYERENQTDDAHAAYCKALELAPDHAETLRHLGKFEIIAGRLDAGIGMMIKAQEAGLSADVVSECLYDLAGHFVQRNKYDDALLLCRTALELSPDNLWPKVRLAEIYELTGEPDAALQIYREIMMERPESPVTAKKMDALLKEMQTPADTIIVEWTVLVEYHPQAATPLWYLGKSLGDAGHSGDACDVFARARAINPDIATAIQP